LYPQLFKFVVLIFEQDSNYEGDKLRRFVISFRMADDMISIYEPPLRNAGILGGKFLERTRALKPGSSLSDPNGPIYYESNDLFVGCTLEIYRHRFVLVEADEYVFAYMEQMPEKYPFSNRQAVWEKAHQVPQGVWQEIKETLENDAVDGIVPREKVMQAMQAKEEIRQTLNQHVRNF
jgi:hypothetical protein